LNGRIPKQRRGGVCGWADPVFTRSRPYHRQDDDESTQVEQSREARCHGSIEGAPSEFGHGCLACPRGATGGGREIVSRRAMKQYPNHPASFHLLCASGRGRRDDRVAGRPAAGGRGLWRDLTFAGMELKSGTRRNRRKNDGHDGMQEEGAVRQRAVNWEEKRRICFFVRGACRTPLLSGRHGEFAGAQLGARCLVAVTSAATVPGTAVKRTPERCFPNHFP